MVWEAMRHNWASLQAMVGASEIPTLINKLLTATNYSEVKEVFAFIENNIVTQGGGYLKLHLQPQRV
jgi:hypothetical protein